MNLEGRGSKTSKRCHVPYVPWVKDFKPRIPRSELSPGAKKCGQDNCVHPGYRVTPGYQMTRKSNITQKLLEMC